MMDLPWKMIFSLLITLTLATVVVPLEFSPPLSDINVVIGNPLWWTCSVLRTGQQAPRLSYVWRFQNGDMEQDGTRIDYGNGTLYFPQVLNSHLGQYTCVVSDSQSAAIVSTAWLRQAYISSIVLVQPSNQPIELGGVIILDCRIDGQPAPSLQWTLNGQTVVRTSRINITDLGAGHNILQISNSSYADSGSYTCIVNHILLTQPMSSAPALVRVYGKPVLTNALQDQAVPTGYNVTFICSANSDPKATISWLFTSTASDVPVQISSSPPSIIIDNVNSILQLFKVDGSRIGKYSCTLSNQYGSDYSQAKLNVAGQPQAPAYILRPQDISLVEGDDVYLSCNGTGNPLPKVFWVDPAGVVFSGNAGSQSNCSDTPIFGETRICPGNNSDSNERIGRATTDSTGSLTLKNVSSSDLGVYICKLINAEGVAESHVFVSVLYKPDFTTSPQSMTVSEGSQFILPCVAAGNPQPAVSWTLPGMSSLNLTSVNSGVNSNKNEVVLEIGNLVVMKATRAHHGTFTCYASNNMGSSAASATVSVSGAPHFAVIPVSQGVIEGDNVILQCQVDAYPTAQVDWYYRYIMDPSIESTDILHLKETLSQGNPTNNMTLLPAAPSTRYSFVNGTSLQYVDVEGRDAGLYLCVANNGLGSTFEPAILRVITYPVFQVKPSDTKVSLRSAARLDCLSVGIPVPSQRWVFKQMKVEMSSGKVLFINGSLGIENLQESDLGNYTCFATNQAGQRTMSAMLTLSSLPYFLTAPSNTTAVSGSKAVLMCRGSDATSFQVSWYLSDANGNQLQFLGLTVVNTVSQQPSSSADQPIAGSRLGITPEGDLAFACVENSDSTWYICSLQNSDGSTSSNPVFLTVNDLPVIIATEAPVKVVLGQTANMTCQAQNSPLPTISWLTPLKLEYTTQNTGEVTVAVMETSRSLQSTLTIKNLQMDRDAGVWTCKACNIVGCRLQRVTLNLEGGVVIRQIIGEEKDNNYLISCVTAGIPAPYIAYASKEIPITNQTEGHTVYNGDLWIQKDKILREYTCNASSVNGSTAAPIAIPEHVSIVNVKPMSTSFIVLLNYSEPIPYLTPNKVLMSFAVDGTNVWQNQTFYLLHDLEHYLQVENGTLANNDTMISCTNGADNIVKRDATLDTSVPEAIKVSIISTGIQFVYSIEAQLQDLKPNTAYVLQAVMANILGAGPYTAQVSAETLAAAPSAVTNVNVEVYGSTANVSWTPPNPLNGLPEDTFITVQMYNSSSQTQYIQVMIVNVTDIPQASFSNVKPGDYILNIFVSNRQTNTESSTVTAAFQVQEHPPTYKTNITGITALNAHEIQLDWSVPLDPNTIFPPITGYTIELSKLEENESNSMIFQKLLNVPGESSSSWKIEHLSENTTYSTRVACRNSAGLGPYSVPMNTTTETENDTTWQTMVITVTVVCAVIVIVSIIIVVVYKVKVAKSKSIDLDSQLDTDGESNNNIEEEMQHDQRSVAASVEGHENEGFILY